MAHPLLERDDELASLRVAVAEAGEGHGCVVLIGCEAGIGKTTLLRAVREEVTAGAFLVGRCEPLSIPVPLWPLRELADAAGAPRLPELDREDRTALARSLLAVLRDRGPVVAVVEDAHWADPATLDVVRMLARRVEDEPVVLVVTYRDDETATNPPLAMLLGDVATNPSVVRIALSPLSPVAVRALAGERSVDVAEVLRVTGGNPFLVVEALATDGGVPSSVRDATIARVARLAAEARRAVEAAAVVGQRVEFAVLVAVVPESEAAIEEALSTGVLTDDGATLGFRHELMRQAVEQSISSPRRAELHRRVLIALEGRADDALLAHHAEQAGLRDEAARHALAAAGHAERVGALLEAGLQLERVLRLGESEDLAGRRELLVRYARAMNFAGRRLEDARDAAQEAVRLADAACDTRGGARARSVLSATLWSLDELVGARAAAEEAVRLLDHEADPMELARAHAARLRIESIAFDPEAVIAAAPAALAIAEQAGAVDARIDITVSLGLAHGHRGEPQSAELLDTARNQARAEGVMIPAIRAHVNALSVAADARDHRWADRVMAQASDLFTDSQTTIPRLYTLAIHARSLVDRGAWDDALAQTKESRTVWHGGDVVADGLEALVAARRGEAGATELVVLGLERIAELPSGWRHLFLAAVLVEISWIEGDFARARRAAEAALGAPYAWQLARPAGDTVLWGVRCGAPPPTATQATLLPQPVLLELAGDWRAAMTAWQELDTPYEAALAALPADERAARAAVATLRRLGADGAARAFARERHRQGAASLRGPRRSTLANTAGLTRREQEVLQALAGGATNAQLADRLHLSERTVAHHVSAILAKLGAPTRTAAVDAARAAGLLDAQDGPR